MTVEMCVQEMNALPQNRRVMRIMSRSFITKAIVQRSSQVHTNQNRQLHIEVSIRNRRGR